MVSIAYASPFQIQHFNLFPEVLHIDVTADTNKEGRPLCTITTKDSNDKFFIVLMCFMANKKGWSFKWLFQNALPLLLSKGALKKCQFVITDGDLVCINQLEIAINTFMPWTKRGRCTWHIIDRG